ncbi:unnamed protein product [Urochloa humidicola]
MGWWSGAPEELTCDMGLVTPAGKSPSMRSALVASASESTVLLFDFMPNWLHLAALKGEQGHLGRPARRRDEEQACAGSSRHGSRRRRSRARAAWRCEVVPRSGGRELERRCGPARRARGGDPRGGGDDGIRARGGQPFVEVADSLCRPRADVGGVFSYDGRTRHLLDEMAPTASVFRDDPADPPIRQRKLGAKVKLMWH